MKTKQEFEIIHRRGELFFSLRLLIGIQLLLLLNDTVAENKFGESRVKFFKSFSCTISLENQVLETEESLSPHSERIKSY